MRLPKSARLKLRSAKVLEGVIGEPARESYSLKPPSEASITRLFGLPLFPPLSLAYIFSFLGLEAARGERFASWLPLTSLSPGKMLPVFEETKALF